MLGNILPPYHSLQELNLDWILTKVKNILRFVPDDGAVGQVLRRTPHGAEWSDEQGAGGSVTSVNGMQGAVVLDAADVGALPDTTVIPDSTSDLINDAGFVDAAGAAAAAPVQSVNGQTGAVVISSGAVDSVNGQTGTVVLDASDVGALPDTTVIPDSTSDLINDAGFVNAAGAAAAAPVQSVNGQTGAVTIPVGSDYVTETGTSGSWVYRKWNSGKMEAWYTDQVTFPSPQQGPYNGFYRHVKSVPLVTGFTAINMVLAQGQNSCMFISAASATTTDVTLYLIHISSNNSNIDVNPANIYVVGSYI